MKKLYKTLLALAAVMTLGAVASAQDVPYYRNKDHGLGYNKYLRTDKDGNRFIRIETFATGGGERKAIPADICLVLDNSGSMLYYYCLDESAYKPVLTQAEVEAPVASGKDSLLVVDTHYYLKGYTYERGSGGSFGASDQRGSSYKCFDNKPAADATQISMMNCFRYAKHSDGKYYVVYHKTYKDDSNVTWYYLCYKPENGPEMYLHNNNFTSTRPTDTAFKSSSKTLFIGSKTGKIIIDGTEVATNTLLYRAKTRMEKLLESVKAFIDQIYTNNQLIEPELEGKVGNQIAIVAFGEDKYSTTPYDPDFAPGDYPAMADCRIVKIFTPANNDTNVAKIKGGLDRMNFLGNTSIGRGMLLAHEAFRLLRDGHPEMDAYEMKEDGVTYKTDEADHPIVNRSKVVVMFTDGAPTKEGNCTIGSTTFTEYDATRARSIYYSNQLKKVDPGFNNAKVFTVGLNPDANATRFLKYVSSNYGQVTYTGGTSAGSYSPRTASSNLYFMNAGEKDLKDVFNTIASIAGGTSDVGGSSLVNIDIVSGSFQIPRGNPNDDLAQKIKVYTAQCLGLDPDKTYEEKGVIKHYLAFAEPKEIKSREPVKLWVSKPVEGSTTDVTWELETIDVDEGISVTVEKDPTDTTKKDVIKVTGFDYAKFWCGFDGDPNHSTGADANTEDYVASDYGSYDLGTGPYIKGYRGFKIIIDIPIALQDNAVGGPSVNTNEAGSGLLDPKTGTLFVAYPRPKLTIPVNLWIQKEGLQKGESASFVILRKLAEATTEEPNPTYKPLTNVLVSGETKDDGTSKPVMVKLLNLDPAYYYKVVEEGWSWSYTSNAQNEETAPSTETVLTNPIIIKNTPKTSTPKHDEAVKRNNM